MKLTTPRVHGPRTALRGGRSRARRRTHPAPPDQAAHHSLRMELATIADNHASAALKDIPRLIKRTRIHIGGAVLPPDDAAAPRLVFDGVSAAARHVPVLQCVCDALSALTRHFHGHERAEAAQATMRDLLARPDTPADCQEAVAMLLAPHIEATSPEWRVLRQLNQSVVLAGMARLYETVLKGVMVKDVKGPTGWAVDVLVGKDRVGITHTRRERGAVVHGKMVGGEAGHWDLVWEVSQTFSAQADRTTAAFVRIVRLDFAEFKGPNHDQFALQAALPCGLIVC